MKRILLLMGLAAMLGTVVGCEEEEHEHHHPAGGAYYGPGGYGTGEYHGYPDYNTVPGPYYQHPYRY